MEADHSRSENHSVPNTKHQCKISTPETPTTNPSVNSNISSRSPSTLNIALLRPPITATYGRKLDYLRQLERRFIMAGRNAHDSHPKFKGGVVTKEYLNAQADLAALKSEMKTCSQLKGWESLRRTWRMEGMFGFV
jgi:hypothetical protein